MHSRAFGWIQNPSDFKKLKLVVQVFDSKSEHYKNLKNRIIPNVIYFESDKKRFIDYLENNVEEFTYLDLVGSQRNKNNEPTSNRREAVANSLLQVTILPQSVETRGKRYTDNWTADGFLRWAVSFNFVESNRELDTFKITDLGKEFSRTADDSDEELEILKKAILRYPPATQVLSLLAKSGGWHTKFYIGNELGFIGEKGFTSYDESLMIDWLKTTTNTKEQTAIRQDVEGTSDKYARMISGWLKKVGFVEQRSTKLVTPDGEIRGFPEYSISGSGLHAIRQAHGSSKNTRVTKFVMWEFFATTGKNKDYIRTRRAYILKIIQTTKSFNILMAQLEQLGFKDDKTIIKNDLSGLNTSGIRIEYDDNRVDLKDNLVDFSIPELDVTEELKDAEIEKRKSDFMNNTDLPVKFIELLEIAYDGKRNRDFEIITIELFRKVYGLNAVLLGGGRKPDGLVSTNDYGIIIDTKAYSNGYSKSISQEDEMVRYIEDNQLRDKNRNPIEWWENFPQAITQDNFYFMWISSKFIGRFQEQLSSTYHRTNTKGAALNVEQLLLGADAIIKGKLNIDDIPDHIENKEIIWF